MAITMILLEQFPAFPAFSLRMRVLHLRKKRTEELKREKQPKRHLWVTDSSNSVARLWTLRIYENMIRKKSNHLNHDSNMNESELQLRITRRIGRAAQVICFHGNLLFGTQPSNPKDCQSPTNTLDIFDYLGSCTWAMLVQPKLMER